MIESRYKRWMRDDMVLRFSTKTIDEYFLTEINLLEKIIANVKTVLDVGP